MDYLSVKGEMYKTNLIGYVLLVGILMMVQPLMAQHNSETNRFFQAGAAKSNITPRLGEPIVGNWDEPPANYIHDEISVIIQAFKIGDLGIGGIPFETFAETGLEIKEKSPFNKTFTISFANGSFGYLPTPEQHRLGGYETWLSTNRVEEVASEKIVAQLLNLFSSMY